MIDCQKAVLLMFFTNLYDFLESTSNKIWLISFDWFNIFEKIFHRDDDLLLWKCWFFCSSFFIFIFIFQFFPNFLFDNIPLKNIFSTITKSHFNSNSIKSYRPFLSQLKIILTYTFGLEIGLKSGHLLCQFWRMSLSLFLILRFWTSYSYKIVLISYWFLYTIVNTWLILGHRNLRSKIQASFSSFLEPLFHNKHNTEIVWSNP